MNSNSYKDLVVWQKSMDLVVKIYQLTEAFPKAEIFGMVAQMRRSAVSIPSNIAEGSKRGTKKDFRHFLLIAYGSGAELETQIEISKRLNLSKLSDFVGIDDLLSEVMRMLNVFVVKLKTTS
ncbi:MAG: four helix bundle protein [Candidatus Doudnabacteria bacterium]|nr:four helix bundle protein [Candidatus Doudnabacteria bacterium]